MRMVFLTGRRPFIVFIALSCSLQVTSVPLHCMSHQSLDHTTCPVSCASAHGRPFIGHYHSRRSCIVQRSARCRSGVGHTHTHMLDKSRQYCAGTRLRAKIKPAVEHT